VEGVSRGKVVAFGVQDDEQGTELLHLVVETAAEDPQQRKALAAAVNASVTTRTGIVPEDRVLLACTTDRCFMAGMAYFLGLNRIGAMSIRSGGSHVSQLAAAVRRHRPTAMIAVPTQAEAVARHMDAEGDVPADMGVRLIVCIGEPVRSADLRLSVLGRRLSEAWGATVAGTYASTEMATAFTDCECGCGGHLLADLVVLELLDDSNRPVPNMSLSALIPKVSVAVILMVEPELIAKS